MFQKLRALSLVCALVVPVVGCSKRSVADDDDSPGTGKPNMRCTPAALLPEGSSQLPRHAGERVRIAGRVTHLEREGTGAIVYLSAGDGKLVACHLDDTTGLGSIKPADHEAVVIDGTVSAITKNGHPRVTGCVLKGKGYKSQDEAFEAAPTLD